MPFITFVLGADGHPMREPFDFRTVSLPTPRNTPETCTCPLHLGNTDYYKRYTVVPASKPGPATVSATLSVIAGPSILKRKQPIDDDEETADEATNNGGNKRLRFCDAPVANLATTKRKVVRPRPTTKTSLELEKADRIESPTHKKKRVPHRRIESPAMAESSVELSNDAGAASSASRTPVPPTADAVVPPESVASSKKAEVRPSRTVVPVGPPITVSNVAGPSGPDRATSAPPPPASATLSRPMQPRMASGPPVITTTTAVAATTATAATTSTAAASMLGQPIWGADSPSIRLNDTHCR
jgi:hypothetical protein